MNLKNLHEHFLQKFTLLTAGMLCIAQASIAQPASSYSFAASAVPVVAFHVYAIAGKVVIDAVKGETVRYSGPPEHKLFMEKTV